MGGGGRKNQSKRYKGTEVGKEEKRLNINTISLIQFDVFQNSIGYLPLHHLFDLLFFFVLLC